MASFGHDGGPDYPGRMPARKLIKAEPISTRESNRLYHGDVRDFRDAMRAIIRGMQAERRESEAYNASLDDDEQEFRLPDTGAFKSYEIAAGIALALYDELIRKAEADVLARLRTLPGDDMERIADALASGDYAGLAW